MRPFAIIRPGMAGLFILAAGAANAAPLGLDAGRIWVEIPFGAGVDGIPALGDANGDGKQDLVLYNQQDGTARVALSTGGRFAVPKLWSFGLPKQSPNSFFPFSLGDANGDGKDDLIIFQHGDGQAAGSANTYVALSTGVGFQFPPQHVWNAGFCITEQDCQVADVNGDGRDDIVAFTKNFGLVWVSLSTGSGFGQNAIWNNFFCIQGEQCALGDVDGDKRADIIAFKPTAPGVQKGNVLVAASAGQTFGPVRLGHGFFCIDAERCLVGDFNGDKRADVMLVKALTAEPTPAEVLASLSNGTTFINPAPFTWGHPTRPPGNTGWGSFMTGDVTGDGKADLVQSAIISVTTAGGGQRTVKTVYVVYPVREGAGAPTPVQPPPDENGQPAGFEHLTIRNCDPDHHAFHYWIADATDGSVEQEGPEDALYSDAGFCPDPQQEALTIDLDAGHVYSIVAVDPEAIGCDGRNDPTIVACAKHNFGIVGAANGKTAYVTLQSGPAWHTLLLAQLPPEKSLLDRLLAAGIDYSVSDAEIKSWMSNTFSQYMQFGEGLLALMDGRKLKAPLYIDVAFWEYGQAGGKVELENPTGALDIAKARNAMLRAFNTRNGASETEFWALLKE